MTGSSYLSPTERKGRKRIGERIPAGPQVLHQGVVMNRPLVFASSSSQIERDEMATTQEVAEIRGGEDELVFVLSHNLNLGGAGTDGQLRVS